jgi:GDP/UDP-N,N'-diacetylbacillosamine 2-epimerase (hydrolysing)
VRRRILVVSGIRSEYDILYPAMCAVQAHPELELLVCLTGAHLSARFGSSADWATRDGFEVVDRIESLFDSDQGSGRLRGAAVQLLGLSQCAARAAPDFLFVCGDREEAMTTALVGAYQNIPVAHLAGGDLAVGNVDDSVRHAVTKLSHLHLTLSEQSAERVRKLGEEPWRVHAVGNPALDRFRSTPRWTRRELAKELGLELGDGPLVLVIQHVISSESEAGAAQLRTTLEAVAASGCTALIGQPNSDAGSRAMCDVIREFAQRHPQLHPIPTLPREPFVNLLREASVLVGNSSLGVLEAPFLGLPVVNVGRRQGGREHARNLLFVPHERSAIRASIERALFDTELRDQIAAAPQPFGDGCSGPRIAEILARAPERERLLVKQWTF